MTDKPSFFKQRPFPFALLVLAILIMLYSVGYSLALYLTTPEFSFITQGLSSLWISLVILGLALYFGQFSTIIDYKIKSFLIAFVSTTFIAVVWEVVKMYYRISDIGADNYSFVTAMNILTNAVGGTLAHFYFVMRRKNREETAQILYPKI